MPEHNHQLRTARGTWSQAQLAEAANAAIAHATGAEGALTAKYISDLERGRYTWPGQHTRNALCKVLGAHHPADLGFTPRRSSRVSSPALQTPPFNDLDQGTVPTIGDPDSAAQRVTPQLIDSLHQVFNGYVQTDRLLGPKPLVRIIQHQAAWVEELATGAPRPVRSELLTIAAGFCELAGWVLHDAGHLDGATTWTNKALTYAVENGDPRVVNYVLTRKSNIATDAGRGDEGLSLAEAALRYEGGLTPRLRALSYRQQAKAHALIGDPSSCARSLDLALSEIDQRTNDDGDRTIFCSPVYVSPAYVEMEAASSWVQLEPRRAIPILEQGLHDWPTSNDERDRGMLLTRLATAHANNGDVDAACTYARQAIDVVSIAHSARAITQLRQLNSNVAHETLAVARDFTDAFSQLTAH